jgi:hypothetical protein
MIKSKSWEISAWNPKDSAMLRALSCEDMKVRGRWGEAHQRGALFIYFETAHRDSYPFENFRPI